MTLLMTQPFTATIHNHHHDSSPHHRLSSVDPGQDECWSCRWSRTDLEHAAFQNNDGLLDGGDCSDTPHYLLKAGFRSDETGLQSPLSKMVSDTMLKSYPFPDSDGEELDSHTPGSNSYMELLPHPFPLYHRPYAQSSPSPPPPPQIDFQTSSSSHLKKRLSKKKSMVGLRRRFILDEEAAMRVLRHDKSDL